MVRVSLPKDVVDILRVLESAGHEAYVVGGAVRDSLLGRRPHDYDVTTSATPDEVEALFGGLGWRVIPIGKRFGVVTVVHPRTGRQVEVATFRFEKYRPGGRKPAEVGFTKSLKEDVARRDFTINALAADRSGRVVDFVGGLRDLQAGVIRFIGDPHRRISEDPLRLLRAPRFMAKLGYRLDGRSTDAIRRDAPLIRAVPAERVRDEFMKAAETPRFAEFVRACVDLGLMEHIIPELLDLRRARHGTRHHHGEDGLEHTIEVLSRLDRAGAPPILKIAGMLHDIGKRHYSGPSFIGHEVLSGREAKDIMCRLKFPAKDVNTVASIARWHMVPLSIYNSMSRQGSGVRSGAVAKRVVWKHGNLAPYLLTLAACDASGDAQYTRYMLGEAEEARRLLKTILAKPIVTGRDILALAKGIPPGPWVGKVKREVFRIQLEKGITDKQTLLKICRDIIRRATGRDLRQASP